MPLNLVITGAVNLDETQLQTLERRTSMTYHRNNPASGDQAEVIARLSPADVCVVNAYTRVTAEVLDHCPMLTHLVTTSVGVSHIDLARCQQQGIAVSHFPDYCAQTLAEKIIGFILMGMHRLVPAIDNYRAGRWDYQAFRGREIQGKTLCILGLGRSGRALRTLAVALGMEVCGTHSKTSREEQEAFMRQADVVALTMASNEATHHFVNRETCGWLKPEVLLVNTARGNLVDDAALKDFLTANPKACAILDVLEQEPPDANHVLSDCPNVIITPHVGYDSVESNARLQHQVYTCVTGILDRLGHSL